MSLTTDILFEVEKELESLSTDIHYEWMTGPAASEKLDDIIRKLSAEIERLKGNKQ